MRVVAKFSLVLALAISCVLAADGLLTVKREADLFDRDMRQDAQRFGALLANALGDVLETRGEKRAVELVLQANAVGEFRIRWIQLDASAQANEAPRAPEAAAGLKNGEARSIQINDGESRLYTYVAVGQAGRYAIEIAQPLRDRDEYVAATIRSTIILVVLTIMVCLLLTLLIGTWIVGRPIAGLIARARAIGVGELVGEVSVPSRDELGTLSREINSMSQHLLVAREVADREHKEKLQAEKQLRHADRLTTVGTLAAGVAHELGSPLNVVIERAIMIDGETDRRSIKRNATIIREQAERMTEIVAQVLTFARRDLSKPTGRHDLIQLAGDSVELISSYAKKRAVEVAVIASEDRIEASIDRDNLQQALTNLAINAIQASPDHGKVQIEISRKLASRPEQIDEPPQPCLIVSVTDQGPGIAPESLARSFEPFFTTKDVGEGTGLGLSVTLGIAREHGGWVDAQSSPDQGSCFSIVIPDVDCPE